MTKVMENMIQPKAPTSNKVINDCSGQIAKTDIETVNITGDDAQKGFMYQIEKEDITAKLFDISSLPDGTSLYYISSE